MASPASAVEGDASSSFGVQATGAIAVAPVAPSAFDSGLSANNVADLTVVGLITTGIIDTTATATGASAIVNDTTVVLAPTATLTAAVIQSSCLFDPISGAVSGTSSIVDGATTVLGVPTTLAANAAPNTTVTVDGIATITLNRQSTSADGTFTVDAIYIELIGSLQTITIASSSCTFGTVLGVSMLPMSSAVAASLLGLSGLVFYVARRRQTQHSLIEG